MLTEERIESNFAAFVARLKTYGVDHEKLMELLPGLKQGTYALLKDSGMAYPGALIDKSIQLTTIALKVNEIMPEKKKCEVSSIIKVCMMQHLSCAERLLENDNQWEVEKRGMLYKYKNNLNTNGIGLSSLLTMVACGVSFTEDEAEAMTIIDKPLEDKSSKFYACVLADIVRIANDILKTLSKKI